MMDSLLFQCKDCPLHIFLCSSFDSNLHCLDQMMFPMEVQVVLQMKFQVVVLQIIQVVVFQMEIQVVVVVVLLQMIQVVVVMVQMKIFVVIQIDQLLMGFDYCSYLDRAPSSLEQVVEFECTILELVEEMQSE